MRPTIVENLMSEIRGHACATVERHIYHRFYDTIAPLDRFDFNTYRLTAVSWYLSRFRL